MAPPPVAPARAPEGAVPAEQGLLPGDKDNVLPGPRSAGCQTTSAGTGVTWGPYTEDAPGLQAGLFPHWL